MDHQNNGIKNIIISLLFALVGLSIGLIFGVRLGLTTIELNFKSNLNNLNSKIDKIDEAQIKCYPPIIPFPLNDSDLEKENPVKPEKKGQPISL